MNEVDIKSPLNSISSTDIMKLIHISIKRIKKSIELKACYKYEIQYNSQ